MREVSFYAEAKEAVMSLDCDEQGKAFDELHNIDGFAEVDNLDHLFCKLAWGFCYQALHEAVDQLWEKKEDQREEETLP